MRAGARGRARQRPDRLDERLRRRRCRPRRGDSGSRRAAPASLVSWLQAWLVWRSKRAATTPQLRRSGRLCNGSIATARGAALARSAALVAGLAGRGPRPRRTCSRSAASRSTPPPPTRSTAREQALLQGQIEGLRRLLRRLVPAEEHGRLPAVGPGEIERYVQNFEIADEEVASNRYLAQLTVRYEPDAVRELLQAAGAALRRGRLDAGRGAAAVPDGRTARGCGRRTTHGGRRGPTTSTRSGCCAWSCRSATSRTWPRVTRGAGAGRRHRRARRARRALRQRGRAGRRSRRRGAGAQAATAPRRRSSSRWSGSASSSQSARDLAPPPGRDARGSAGRGGARPAGQPRRALEERQPLALRSGRASWWSTSRLHGCRIGSGSVEGWRACRRSVRSRSPAFARDNVRAQIRYIGDSFASKQALGAAWLGAIAGRGVMAVATNGRKSQPRRAGERDVDLVLGRSPVNLANLVTLGRLLMVVPLVWLIATERLEAAFWLFVAAARLGRRRRLHRQELQRRRPISARTSIRSPTRCCSNGIYLALAIGGWLPVVAGRAGDRPRPADRRRRDADPAPPSGVPRGRWRSARSTPSRRSCWPPARSPMSAAGSISAPRSRR